MTRFLYIAFGVFLGMAVGLIHQLSRIQYDRRLLERLMLCEAVEDSMGRSADEINSILRGIVKD
jgi:hypothetical protein